jgi:hypothetical protein
MIILYNAVHYKNVTEVRIFDCFEKKIRLFFKKNGKKRAFAKIPCGQPKVL